MKTRNVLAHVFGFVAAAFMLAAPLTTSAAANTVSTGVASSHSQIYSVAQQAAPAATTQPAAQAPAVQKFDGPALYKAVFEGLRDYHFKLTDPAVRAKWVAEWQNKHANDHALDTEEGTDKAVFEMIGSLGQRFDYYMQPENHQAENAEEDATLVGIGSTLGEHGFAKAVKQLIADAKTAGTKPDEAKYHELQKLSDDRPIIIYEPIPGGPADKAGLKKGDYIIAVDGKSVNGETLEDAIKTIKGKEGTTVNLTISRDNGKGGRTTSVLSIVRAKVVSPDVKFQDLGNGISYIKLNNFMSQFGEQEMKDALTKAAKGKAIILDLRGNPGGRLDAVETMAQYFLDHGPMITLEERQGDATITVRSILEPDFGLTEVKSSAKPDDIQLKNEEREDVIVPADMPIVVLVDEGSASAAEILSGLLQFNHRAIVVGKPTVGKGVGQTVIQLPFDRSIHVTNFEFLPAGVRTDWIGIIPDITVDQPDLADPEQLILDPSNDAQLNAAVKAVQDLVTKADSAAKTREDLNQKNHADFQKELDARQKANDKPASDKK